MISAADAQLIRGLLETYKNHLSIEEIASGIAACILNARELLGDANILLATNRIPRAVSILIAAMEEIGKVSVLCGMARIPVRNQSLWAEAWANFKDHGAKSTLAFVHTFPDEARSSPDAMLFGAELQAHLWPLAERLRQLGLYVDFHGTERRWIRPSELPESEAISWRHRIEGALSKVEAAEALGLFSAKALKIQREVFGPINERRPKRTALTEADSRAIREHAVRAQRLYWQRMVDEGVIDVAAEITIMGKPLAEFLRTGS